MQASGSRLGRFTSGSNPPVTVLQEAGQALQLGRLYSWAGSTAGQALQLGRLYSWVGSTAGQALQPVWIFWRREKPLSPTENRTRDRPACSPVTIPTTLHWLLDAKLIDMVVKDEVENR